MLTKWGTCRLLRVNQRSCYMFVIKYYENGNLYSYLEESMGVLCWRDIVYMLWSISSGLNFIHEHDHVHGHLHGGNILVEDGIDLIDAKITDTGLHGPADNLPDKFMA